MNTDKPLLAIPLMLSGCSMIVIMNVFAKLLADLGLNPIEIVFYRNCGSFFIVVSIILILGNKERFKTKRPKAQFTRALIGNICLALVFWSMSLLPLATATAILLSSPVIATALSPLFLKEKLSWIRWSCVFLGFIGALIIAQPTSAAFDYKYLIAGMAALSSAGAIITLRDLGKTEDALTTNFYFLGLGSLFPVPYMLFYATDLNNIPLWILSGVIVAGFLNQFLKTLAYRFADLSFLSPFNYFNIIWATLFGWLVWNDLPALQVYIGCGIIILSNLLITWREHILKNRAIMPAKVNKHYERQ